MHRFVLENCEHRVGAIEQRVARPHKVLVLERVDYAGIRLFDKIAHGLP